MRVYVVDRTGREHALDAVEGWRVMEVIRDWGLDIKAECGGACACASCHVYVDENWAERLHPPTEEELGLLDAALAVEPTSRLSCQIPASSRPHGLKGRQKRHCLR